MRRQTQLDVVFTVAPFRKGEGEARAASFGFLPFFIALGDLLPFLLTFGLVFGLAKGDSLSAAAPAPPVGGM